MKTIAGIKCSLKFTWYQIWNGNQCFQYRLDSRQKLISTSMNIFFYLMKLWVQNRLSHSLSCSLLITAVFGLLLSFLCKWLPTARLVYDLDGLSWILTQKFFEKCDWLFPWIYLIFAGKFISINRKIWRHERSLDGNACLSKSTMSTCSSFRTGQFFVSYNPGDVSWSF